MPRPPLPIGSHGAIDVVPWRSGYLARTRYRDEDGVTRKAERTGTSKTAARTNLLRSLKERAGSRDSSGLSADSRFSVTAELWLACVKAAGDAGELSLNTVELYERQLRNHALPALGALQLREVTNPRVDAALRKMRDEHGASTVKTTRSVVSGVMRLAIRHGAVTINPTREITPIKPSAKRAPRALTERERADWIGKLEADPRAVVADLPDLTRWMLGTGVRIGEALALSWDELDVDAGSVRIAWKIIRVRGHGLVRVPRVKGADGERVLALPRSVLAMLARRSAGGADGPLFPDSRGGWRDPSNTLRAFREARERAGFDWVTSHVFRKTVATILDESGHSARAVADQLGHAKPSMTQDVYMGRGVANPRAAADLDRDRESDEG
jgi:integrase